MLVQLDEKVLKEYMKRKYFRNLDEKYLDIMLDYYKEDYYDDFEYLDDVFYLYDFDSFCANLSFITKETLEKEYPLEYGLTVESSKECKSYDLEDLIEDNINDDFFGKYYSCLFVIKDIENPLYCVFEKD